MTSLRSGGSAVLIVGAGVIGSAAALSFARHGHEVLVLEAGHAVGHGSTAASAGIARVHAADAQSCRIAADAIEVWEQWAAFLDAAPTEDLASFRRCGSVILDAGNGYIETVTSAMEEAGVGYERWDTQQLADSLPYLDVRRFGPPCPVDDDEFWTEPDGVLAGAIHTPSSGYVGDPALAARNMMDAAIRHGARLRLAAPVEKILVDASGVAGVTLSSGERLRADVVLVAAGPHTDGLVRRLGALDDFTVTTRRLREELHHVPAPPELAVARDGVHLVDGDLGINFRPETGNAFLVGGDGANVDGETVVADPDDFDERVSQPLWQRNTLRLARRIPGIGVPNRPSGVVGLYDVTDDWLPVYDATAISGLYVAMGTSGNQFKTAPIVGDLLRQLVESGAEAAATTLVSPVTAKPVLSAQFSGRRVPATGGSRG